MAFGPAPRRPQGSDPEHQRGTLAAVDGLADLLREHIGAPFPESVVRGQDYGEVDAVMVGADIYGWGLQAAERSLTAAERERLSVLREQLQRSLDAFPSDARPYYETLLAIADAALAIGT